MKRLIRESEKFQKECPDICTGGPVSQDNLRLWQVTMFGPKDSPYEGGHFMLQLNLPNEFPFKPPDVKFLTKILHPNIAEDGSICLDTIAGNWSPSLTISKLMISLCSLLTDPNPDDPLRSDIAGVYFEDIEKYNSQIREHTKKHAFATNAQ